MAPLATRRLLLRRVERNDLSRIVALAGDAAVATGTASIPHPLAPADAEAWFLSLAGEGGTGEAFAVTRREEGELIGVVGLVPDAKALTAEIGYWVGRPWWGQGYATESVRRVLRFAFGELGLRTMKAAVFPDNPASMRVLEKAGFAETGRALHPAPARGGEQEVVLFAITRAGFARAALSQAVGPT